MKGHLGLVVRSKSLVGRTVLITESTTLSVSTTSSAKLWAIGGGGSYQSAYPTNYAGLSGGVAYKAWQWGAGDTLTVTFASRGVTVNYASTWEMVANAMTQFSGGGYPLPVSGDYSSFSASGGASSTSTKSNGGALATSIYVTFGRQPVVPNAYADVNYFDEQAMMDAAAAAGLKVLEDNSPTAPAFGSGGYYDATGSYSGSPLYLPPGYGGGFAGSGNEGGAPCVLLKLE